MHKTMNEGQICNASTHDKRQPLNDRLLTWDKHKQIVALLNMIACAQLHPETVVQ